MDISFFEIDITHFGKTQFRNMHSTGVEDSEKDRHNITAVWIGIRHRPAFINCIKKALKFLICINMCIIPCPFFVIPLGGIYAGIPISLRYLQKTRMILMRLPLPLIFYVIILSASVQESLRTSDFRSNLLLQCFHNMVFP